MKLRIGNGFDVHQLADGLPLILGGIEIEHTKGCVAHSDGDVLIHALCDALLGALSLGDIGQHFPDSDEQYKGIDSRILLSQCMDMVKERGYFVVNADCTIAMQRPKLAPHIPLMRKSLAQVMELDVDEISVKATTTEHLGFCGREEGVAVMATVLLAQNEPIKELFSFKGNGWVRK